MKTSTSHVSVHAPVIVDERPSPRWIVGEQRQLRGYAAEWAEPGLLLVSRGNRLYQTPATGAPLSPFFSFPTAAGSLASRFRLAQRAFRMFYYNVLRLPANQFFLTFGRDLGVLRNGEFHKLVCERPCRVLRGSCAVHPNGDVYFGEYRRNPAREAVHVYRYRPGGDQVEVVHTFPAGQVRHVHGVYLDPFDKSLWCLTGDLEHECRMLRTTDGFASLEVVGAGDETWRAVSVQFTADAVFYGMDAEFRANHVFRIDKKTGSRTDLGEVDGPVYYSKTVGQDHFFGVTAELCPSQKGRNATLWRVDDEHKLVQVTAHEKDRFGKRFMPGTLHFPAGPGRQDQLIYHAVGLANADNRTFVVQRAPAESQADERQSAARAA